MLYLKAHPVNNHRAGAEDRALSSAKLLPQQIEKELFALARERQIKGFWDVEQATRTLTHLQWDSAQGQHCVLGEFSTAPFLHMEFHFRDYTLKKHPSISAVHLSTTGSCFPLQLQPFMSRRLLSATQGLLMNRLIKEEKCTFSQTKYFSSRLLKRQQTFPPPPFSRLSRQDGGWGRGEGGSSRAL